MIIAARSRLTRRHEVDGKVVKAINCLATSRIRHADLYRRSGAQVTPVHDAERPGRAEEVAAAILFLASDDAPFVTGVLLFVAGGMTAL
jgi:NAD(P)-dependent dehydrogenase (short-subunit alcohol dehydrogenase family)